MNWSSSWIGTTLMNRHPRVLSHLWQWNLRLPSHFSALEKYIHIQPGKYFNASDRRKKGCQIFRRLCTQSRRQRLQHFSEAVGLSVAGFIMRLGVVLQVRFHFPSQSWLKKLDWQMLCYEWIQVVLHIRLLNLKI